MLGVLPPINYSEGIFHRLSLLFAPPLLFPDVHLLATSN